MKKKLFLFLLCLLAAQWQVLRAQEWTWTTGTPVDGETYYLYNVDNEGFLTAANDWGKRASLSKTDAIPFRFELQSEGKYKLYDTPPYPSGKGLNHNGYVADDASIWSITEASEGVYNIKNGDSYLYGRSDTKTSVATSGSTGYDNKWRLLSRTAYIQYAKDNATDESPVDLTQLIPAHFFNNSTTDTWEGVSEYKELSSAYCYPEFWNCTFDMHQTVTDMPNGKYRMKVQAFYRDGDGSTALQAQADAHFAGTESIKSVFYANGAEHAVSSIFANEETVKNSTYHSSTGYTVDGTTYYIPSNVARAGECFKRGDFWSDWMEFTVTNGKMTLGVKCTNKVSGNWTVVKDFKLEYMGALTESIHELGNYAVSAAAGSYTTTYAPSSITISYPDASSSDEEPITLAAEHGITVGGNAASVSCTDNVLTVTALPTTAGSYTIIIPAGAIGFQTSGVTNTEAISLTYTIVEPIIAEAQEGYLYTTVNEATRFLSRGADWGTRAIMHDYGVPIILSASNGDNKSSVQFLENGAYFFPDNSNDMYTDGGEYNFFVELAEGKYRLSKNAGSAYVGLNDTDKLKADKSSTSTNLLTWQVMSKTDYDTYVSEKEAAKRAAFLAGAGITEEDLTKTILKTVKTAEDTETSNYTVKYRNGDESSAEFTITKVYEGLKPGLYIVKMKGLVRNGSVDDYNNQLKKGYHRHMTTLTANGNTINLKTAWECRRTEAIPASGSTHTVEIDGTTYYIPRGDDQAKWMFDNTTLCDNELLTTVGEDGKLTIIFDNPSKLNKTWIPYRDLTVSRAMIGLDGYIKGAQDECDDYAAKNTTSDETFAAAIATAKTNITNATDIDVVDQNLVDVRNAYTVYAYGITDWQSVSLGNCNIENENVQAFYAGADYRNQGAKSVIGNYTDSKLHDTPAAVNIVIPEYFTPKYAMTVTVSDAADYNGSTSATFNASIDPTSTVYPCYNTTPGVTYYYKVEAKDNAEAEAQVITAGTFTTTGKVRMIMTEGGSNIRDLGGRTTVDGKKVRYGRLYRGGEFAGNNTNLTDADKAELLRLGIKADLDFRQTGETGVVLTESALSAETAYKYLNLARWGEDLFNDAADRNRFGQAVHFVAENMTADKPVYFHCVWGADRTGAMGLIMGSILGFTMDEIYKDYELTSFSKAGNRSKGGVEEKITYVQDNGYEGNTIQERIVDFLIKGCGVTQDDINAIRTYMLEDDNATELARVETLKAEYQQVITLAGATWNTDGITTIAALNAEYNRAMNAVDHEVDLTSLIKNPGFETNGAENWEVRGELKMGEEMKTAEFYQTVSSARQSLSSMPAGTYIVKMQGYQRVGGDPTAAAYYTAYTNGQQTTSSYLFLGNERQTLHNAFDDAQNAQIREGDLNPATGVYFPNSINGAGKYFASSNNLYWNVVRAEQTAVGDVTIGVKETSTATYDWTAFDNFRLYYRGSACAASTLTLNDGQNVSLPTTDGYYTISGNRTLKPNCWNTVCLPFDLTAEQQTAAHITDVRTLTSVADNSISISTVEGTMKAGQPYFVRVSENWNVAGNDVLIRAKAPVKKMVSGGALVGYYNPLMGANNLCYVAGNDTDGNKFMYVPNEKTVNLRGMRAYISLDTPPSDVKMFSINMDEETAIFEIETGEEQQTTGIYDLSGRRLGNDNLKHGIYIVNGKKVLR